MPKDRSYIKMLADVHYVEAEPRLAAALAVRSEAVQLGVRAQAVRDWTAAVLRDSPTA